MGGFVTFLVLTGTGRTGSSVSINNKVKSQDVWEPYTALHGNQDNSHNERDPRPKYFAVCTPAGGMYKALNEIDMSRIKSDAGLFLAVKNIYQNGRGFKSRWRMFLKPVSVEFVQV